MVLNSRTSLEDFQRLLSTSLPNEADQKALSFTYERQSITSRIYSFCRGKSLLNDKIAELIKLKIRDHIANTYNVRYEGAESIAIEHTFQELLRSEGYQLADIRRIAVTRLLMNKIPDFIDMVNPGIDLCLNEHETKDLQPDVVSIINYLLGNNFDTKYMSWGMFKALFFFDEARAKDFRRCLELLMAKIHTKLQDRSSSSNDKKILVAILEEVINTIPISEPDKDDRIKIPQLVGENWELVEYEVSIIQIGNEWFGQSIPAFALEPVNRSISAQPMLLFRPTPPFSSKGALLTYAADTIPGKTVGEILYNQKPVQEQLQKWIKLASSNYRNTLILHETSNKEQGIIVGGKSLGGSLAIIAASHQPECISKVLVSGAPTPYTNVRRIYEEKSLRNPPEFKQYCNYGDGVPEIGYGFYDNTWVHKVIVPISQGTVSAHMRMGIAFPKAIVVRIAASKDAQYSARKTANIAHQTFSSLVVPLFATLLGLAFLKTFVVIVVKTIYYQLARRCFGAGIPSHG